MYSTYSMERHGKVTWSMVQICNPITGNETFGSSASFYHAMMSECVDIYHTHLFAFLRHMHRIIQS